jgi:hypothetical protein
MIITDEMLNMLIQVVTSWQVIAVTVAVLLYMLLVRYVARLYRRPRISRSGGFSTAKKVKEMAKTAPEVSDSDELEVIEDE